MKNKINHLIEKYALWPELNNDYQKNIHFGKNKFKHLLPIIEPMVSNKKDITTQIALFYLANEKLSKARIDTQDVLGENELNLYEKYQSILHNLSKELITYITVCSLVEARHDHTFGDITSELENFFEKDFYYSDTNIHKITTLKKGLIFFKQEYPRYARYFHKRNEVKNFINFIAPVTHGIRDALANNQRDYGYEKTVTDILSNDLNNLTLEKTLQYLKIIFSNGNFECGYGGWAWHSIAEHGLKFVNGQINAEMFIDQAFSLEHNNGNIFNKDFLFNSSNTLHIQLLENNENPYKPNKAEILVSNLLLNAQHLGFVGNLFNMEKELKKLNQMNPEDLFETMKQEKQLTDISKDMFLNYVSIIDDAYRSIIDSLSHIKDDLIKNYPELLENNQSEYFDIKNLFSVISDTDCGENQSFECLDSPENYKLFNIWNHLHNEILNPKLDNVIKNEFSFTLHNLENLPDSAFDKNIIGGKAWSLANMNKLGLPVPKAIVFGTDCCSSFYQHKNLFQIEMNKEVEKLYDSLNNDNPILFSVRSGSAVSMPGMMDTVLNVGIDDSNYEYFCNKMGKKVVDKCVNKFMELFCSSRLNTKVHFEGNIKNTIHEFKILLEKHNNQCELSEKIKYNENAVFPLSQSEQIKESLIAVFSSWNSPRAKSYRAKKGISNNLGTAAIIQQMVFGNLNDNSCTGVVFSRNCLTGENKLVGEFLPQAQGEDVVSGSVTPFSIEQFKQFNSKAYLQLSQIAKKLEKQTGEIQDIEFTVEDGKLYILQHRQAFCSPIANLKILKDKNINSTSLIKTFEPKNLQNSYSIQTTEKPEVTGLSANSGVISGIIVRNEKDINEYKEIYANKKLTNPNFGLIFYAKLTSPEHMPLMNQTDAFVTKEGGFTSHAAIIARSLNKPCIVGTGADFSSGDIVTLDATNGKIWKTEHPLLETSKLANMATKALLKSHEIDMKDVTYVENHIKNININSKTWLFNMPYSKEIKTTPIKKSKFLNIGTKVAMILAAEQISEHKKLLTLN